MPRKNASQSRDSRGGGGRRRKRASGSGAFPIDWDRAEALNTGADVREMQAPGIARRKPEKLHNEFIRKLFGFDEDTLEFMRQYRLEEVDDTGGIPIRFEGISKKPKRRIEFTKLGLVCSRGGLVVVSGVVSNADQNEVGLGVTREIRRTSSEPSLDSHNASNRFNVTLGRQPEGFKERELTEKLLGDNVIALSSVIEVNGHVIRPSASANDIDALWERREEIPYSRSLSDNWGRLGYIDEPRPSGDYW
ncbi:MAG TPA: hypothetical protein VHB72_00445 [Candidatus Saccharimonadales bacterium]|nr:hypothetical protein [Candidatus Saccharimonadales bacterium]